MNTTFFLTISFLSGCDNTTSKMTPNCCYIHILLSNSMFFSRIIYPSHCWYLVNLFPYCFDSVGIINSFVPLKVTLFHISGKRPHSIWMLRYSLQSKTNFCLINIMTVNCRVCNINNMKWKLKRNKRNNDIIIIVKI